jgi:hypothetical protein
MLLSLQISSVSVKLTEVSRIFKRTHNNSIDKEYAFDFEQIERRRRSFTTGVASRKAIGLLSP